jgi:hypothetical protein
MAVQVGEVPVMLKEHHAHPAVVAALELEAEVAFLAGGEVAAEAGITSPSVPKVRK